MLFGLKNAELEEFAGRIAATAIVNQAAIKCLAAGLPLTAENIVLLVGDFVDPNRPGSEELVEQISRAVDEIAVNHSGVLNLNS